MGQKRRLLGLRAEQFRHPLDREATQALQRIPGLDMLMRLTLGTAAQEWFYLENMASAVQVGVRQLPWLYELLQEACRILDIDVPQLYVRQHPQPNAYTLAVKGQKPFIVLHTSLVELLTPAEIQAVMAHELGHLKCEHGVYLTLANLLVLAAGQIPNWGLWLAQGLQASLLQWLRCAELSCDRAALLVAQDVQVVVNVLMKLAGGSPSLAGQLNGEAFLAQARAYDQQGWNWLKLTRSLPLTHPVPVLRAQEIDRWSQSPEYRQLLAAGHEAE
ncbi:MAG: M48 family metallopeptidase [Gloeomargarita sp. SKYG116]|nr:M48 family metallopeptidase [Gloeomargarita sp. SKYG116]MDW8401601.1 M48 family metallopeptidase [Gloeomargarita sp. SKYGB_i_bin116]